MNINPTLISIQLFGMVLSGILAMPIPASAGQSQPNPANQAPPKKGIACEELPAEDATNLGLIRQMIVDGRPHAALAFLDEGSFSHPQAEVLRADSLRLSGREDQATEIYRKLLDSCVSGYAYRGLGLIATSKGNIAEAVMYLRIASQTLPTEHTIRNDYGYVLMLAGDSRTALHEFLTAIELVTDYRQAAHNLLLMLYRENDNRAQAFADRFGISLEEQAYLQELANQPLPYSNINQAIRENETGVQQ